uniref:AGC-kinase C-terminal domain-containing protein n=1 Tax=Rhodnius prolixus TaxID=13249 RepID=T1H8A9_RHOPR
MWKLENVRWILSFLFWRVKKSRKSTYHLAFGNDLQLLEKDSKRRLGSGEGDADDIKNHPFFDNIDWEKVKRKDLEVAFKPDLNGPLDLRYIDPTFTQEPVVSSSPDSLTDLSVSVYEEGDIFADFSYAGSINTLHI